MSLQFKPESWMELRKRLPAIREHVFDLEEIAATKRISIRPGQDRQFVFDCPNGIRLIICRETYKGHCAIHISASAHLSLIKRLLAMPAHLVPGELVGQSRAAAFFVGEELATVPDTWSPSGCPHWWSLDDDED